MSLNLIIPGAASIIRFGEIEIDYAIALEPYGGLDAHGWTMTRPVRDDWTAVALMATMKARVCAPLALGANLLADHVAIEQWAVERAIWRGPGARVLVIRWRAVSAIRRAA